MPRAGRAGWRRRRAVRGKPASPGRRETGLSSALRSCTLPGPGAPCAAQGEPRCLTPRAVRGPLPRPDPATGRTPLTFGCGRGRCSPGPGCSCRGRRGRPGAPRGTEGAARPGPARPGGEALPGPAAARSRAGKPGLSRLPRPPPHLLPGKPRCLLIHGHPRRRGGGAGAAGWRRWKFNKRVFFCEGLGAWLWEGFSQFWAR